jgi:amphi-Trp domain-containing protein
MGHEHHHHHTRHDRAKEEMGSVGGAGRTLRVRATLDSGRVADHLIALAHALREGGGTLRSGGQTVVLRAADTVDLEIQAGEEGAQSMVRLALRWRTPVPRADLEITPGMQAPAPRPPDQMIHAHGAGLVLPGDPPAAPAEMAAAPSLTPPPTQGGGEGSRGRKGGPERPQEA